MSYFGLTLTVPGMITNIIFTLVEPKKIKTGLILGLRPANERSRYKVTSSLIGWAQT